VGRHDVEGFCGMQHDGSESSESFAARRIAVSVCPRRWGRCRPGNWAGVRVNRLLNGPSQNGRCRASIGMQCLRAS
jgi:hypothetical protein